MVDLFTCWLIQVYVVSCLRHSTALAVTCYFYDSNNNLIRECIENFERLDDGTEFKSVVIREYLKR